MEQNKKQTAVEWLFAEMYNAFESYIENNNISIFFETCTDIFKQAKEMEKEQLQECAIHFCNYTMDCIEKIRQTNSKEYFYQYYKENYGTE